MPWLILAGWNLGSKGALPPFFFIRVAPLHHLAVGFMVLAGPLRYAGLVLTEAVLTINGELVTPNSRKFLWFRTAVPERGQNAQGSMWWS